MAQEQKDNVALQVLHYRLKGSSYVHEVIRQEGLGIRANHDDKDADVMLQCELSKRCDFYRFEAIQKTGFNPLLDQRS